MNMPNQDDLIYLNGISGTEPGYLVQPFTQDELRDRARKLNNVKNFIAKTTSAV